MCLSICGLDQFGRNFRGLFGLVPCRDLAWIKVFHNFKGWVKSENDQNSWMTSLSYVCKHAPKVHINSAELLTYSPSKFGKILMLVFAKL